MQNIFAAVSIALMVLGLFVYALYNNDMTVKGGILMVALNVAAIGVTSALAWVPALPVITGALSVIILIVKVFGGDIAIR